MPTILKPCSFCGTTPSVKKVTGGWIVYCTISTPTAMKKKGDEHCEHGNVSTAPMTTRDLAIKEWNTWK